MPLAFLLDEHLRGGGLWQAILQHNAVSPYPIDTQRVGDPPDLPLGSSDPDILIWAEREGRVLLTEDVHTMAGHLANHLATGRHSPGIFLLRRGIALQDLVAELALHAHAGDPGGYRDQAQYFPW
jgi:hypothetical protein